MRLFDTGTMQGDCSKALDEDRQIHENEEQRHPPRADLLKRQQQLNEDNRNGKGNMHTHKR